MPQLNQFLGTVLSELTQARVTSDIYSRDTSNFYQQDPVLRSYSVPRVHIDEFEMEMQFAITGLLAEKNDSELPLQKERLLSTFGQKISEKLSQQAIQFFNTDASKSLDTPVVHMMLIRLKHADERVKIGLALTEMLKKPKFFNDEQYFLPEQAVAELVECFIQQATLHLELPEPIKAQLADLASRLTEDTEVLLADLENAFRFLLENQENHNLDIEVCADRLRERPSNTLCHLRLKGCFKNYVWTSSTQQDGSSVQKLVHE